MRQPFKTEAGLGSEPLNGESNAPSFASKVRESPLASRASLPHIQAMSVETLSVPVVPDFLGRVQDRLLREFAAAVHDWSECVAALTRWEDEHLLDHPAPDLLERHKATLQRLMQFGKLLSRSMEQPDFPDRQLAEIVAATQSAYRDKLAMWHGPKMSRAESEKILADCFPE